MWIGASKENKTEPFGIRWPMEPIKALGVYFTYDLKLLKEKNFIEKLDSIKKLINIWSFRGLSILGKVTIIKSFLIPKFVYVCSLLPTPNELLHSNRTLRPFSIKFSIIYSTQTRNYEKLVLELTNYALSAKLSEKHYITYFINALMLGSFGTSLNCIDTACQIR